MDLWVEGGGSALWKWKCHHKTELDWSGYHQQWDGTVDKIFTEEEKTILDETFAEKVVKSGEEWKQEEASVTDGATLVDAI